MGFDLNIVWFEIWIRGEYFMAKHLHEAAQPRIGPKCLGAKVSGSQSEYVLVQGCSFSIKMGGVEMGFDLNIVWFEIWIRGEYFMAKHLHEAAHWPEVSGCQSVWIPK